MMHQPIMTAKKSTLLKGIALSIALLSPVMGLTWSTQAQAAAVSEQQAATALNQYLSRLKSLQANFVQTTKLQKPTAVKPMGFNQTLRSSHLNQKFAGVMQVKRPGLFRWETTSPAKQLIVTNGEMVWIYDPDLEQAVRQKMDQQVANTPALLLSGQASHIVKSFRVTQPKADVAYFELFPKTEDGVFESLGMRFKDNLPTQMVLKDSLGQQTVIDFSHVKLNPNVSDSVFNFVPPEGTDVIDQ